MWSIQYRLPFVRRSSKSYRKLGDDGDIDDSMCGALLERPADTTAAILPYKQSTKQRPPLPASRYSISQKHSSSTNTRIRFEGTNVQALGPNLSPVPSAAKSRQWSLLPPMARSTNVPGHQRTSVYGLCRVV
ncbi:hypothetical protein EJ05DRAFT_277084 [Pseudovirgaria hyperparasitica]|uniref:Uncharacterized protein n=1 Tax=Pseudovirgaria hyperparasitica TaxID=470096 RepID=A0A6A6WBN8_9PEZI|nr:uncharacterized protein EJ05DRAFT_277084 [Pseudovirgaria hyperparasitica]KAF2760242.1 hypothetical protein EJ05DRAFT_277084 [Pseudovirgaria hyperparasitica]